MRVRVPDGWSGRPITGYYTSGAESERHILPATSVI
jgi:hypothetical protein